LVRFVSRQNEQDKNEELIKVKRNFNFSRCFVSRQNEQKKKEKKIKKLEI